MFLDVGENKNSLKFSCIVHFLVARFYFVFVVFKI